MWSPLCQFFSPLSITLFKSQCHHNFICDLHCIDVGCIMCMYIMIKQGAWTSDMLISKPSTRWMVNFGCLCLTHTTMSTLIIQFKMGWVRFESTMSPSVWIGVMLWKVLIFAYLKFIQQHAYPLSLLMHQKAKFVISSFPI